ncbi:MAG TPA: radical SAM protein [Desulfuromonadaceae bacterium]|nr:radical SAM protein [Desulfuromonadaceae bacterium]
MTPELAMPAGRRTPSMDFSGSAFGCPRRFLNNRFVYVVVSARARGLSIGVNMNPDKYCNFDCQYCEVDRNHPSDEKTLDVDVMASELQQTLEMAYSGELRQLHQFHNVPAELLELKQVALSGDGEPTLAPRFLDAVRAVAHVRALGQFPFFKMVLITNATGLDLPYVRDSLKLFTQQDEIWAKLDAGTQNRMDAVNHPDCSLEKVLKNILLTAKQRPVIIQSLFPMLNQQEPSVAEIDEFAARLNELKKAGAQIPLVQIYSATRPMCHAQCSHLPLKTLAHIAQRVREVSGLRAEVF